MKWRGRNYASAGKAWPTEKVEKEENEERRRGKKEKETEQESVARLAAAGPGALAGTHSTLSCRP